MTSIVENLPLEYYQTDTHNNKKEESLYLLKSTSLSCWVFALIISRNTILLSALFSVGTFQMTAVPAPQISVVPFVEETE